MTTVQFDQTLPQGMRPCRLALVNRVLPVNSSAPQITTSIRPREKTLPPMNFDSPTPTWTAASWVTTVASWAPKAM